MKKLKNACQFWNKTKNHNVQTKPMIQVETIVFPIIKAKLIFENNIIRIVKATVFFTCNRIANYMKYIVGNVTPHYHSRY